jgi:translation initiation factor 1
VKPGRVVYSTGAGKLCLGCGWPSNDCRCSQPAEENVPARVHAGLRLERAGRSGKTVTVIEGLPHNAGFLGEVASELKRACGTGGRALERSIELQGDQREKLRGLLASKGWLVKG